MEKTGGITNLDIARHVMGRKSKQIRYVNSKSVQTCGKCGIEKEINKFYNSTQKSTGIDYYCKDCRNACRVVKKRKYKETHKSKAVPKKKECSICRSQCDGTLIIDGIVRCKKCFDKIIYGENPSQWTLPQRSAMLL